MRSSSLGRPSNASRRWLRRLRAVLEAFVSERPTTVLLVTVLNNEARGVQAGVFNAAAEAFLHKSLETAFAVARQGADYQSIPITISHSGRDEPVMARPIKAKKEFRGMMAAVVTLAPIIGQLQEARRAGLEAYIVDNSGRLVASNNPDKYVAGMDLTAVRIVQQFLTSRGQAQAPQTSTFDLTTGGKPVAMLGTYCPIQNVSGGLIVQKKLSDLIPDSSAKKLLQLVFPN